LADATRGEMGTRGTPDLRAEEAAEAARILGVQRVNLGLPDGGLGRDLDATTRRVVEALRTHRPRTVFTHSGTDHHPDHNALHEAVRRACFLSNVLKYETGHERFKPHRLFYFWSHRENLPPRIDFVADVTATYETKMAALRAHRSQVAGTGFEGPATFLTDDLFWHRLHARFGYYGSLIGVKYGEPYIAEGTLRIDDPLALP
jgi:bacillithiol biosynthesis deacetylase BshB1